MPVEQNSEYIFMLLVYISFSIYQNSPILDDSTFQYCHIQYTSGILSEVRIWIADQTCCIQRLNIVNTWLSIVMTLPNISEHCEYMVEYCNDIAKYFW